MSSDENYLKKELYDLLKMDSSVFEFLEKGSLDGIWYWDLEKPENEWMSPQFWTTFGYDPGEKKHLASEWQDLIHPDDLSIAIENFNKHCSNPNHPYDQVVRYRHKNGSTVWVRCRGIAIRDENGKPIRMLGAHNELTQQKMAEEDIIKKRDYAQKILNTVEAIIVVLDREGRVSMVNPKGCRLLGYNEEEIKGQHWFLKFLPQPDGMENVYPFFLRLIAGEIEAAEYFENPVITKTKEIRQIAWHNSLMHDEDGKIAGTLSYGEDITEQKIAEESLKESEARHRSVLETINEGVILQSESGEILTWNKGAEEVFGISAKDAIGQTSDEKDWPTIHEDGSPYEGKDHPSMQTLQTGKPCRNEIMGVYQPSGDLRWISINTNPLYQDGEEKPYAVVISFADITEIKKEKDQSQMYLDATTDGIWTWNFKMNLLFFSPKYYRMLGYKPDAFPADYEHWVNLIHPDDREKALSTAVEYLSTKPDNYENEFRLRTADGHYRWIQARAKVVERDARGEAVLLVGNHEDITQRKKTEQELLESRQKYQTMVENIGIGVSLLNKDMEIIELNKQMREWFPKIDPATKPVCYKVFNTPPKDTICEWCPTCKTLSDGKVHESISMTPVAGGVRNYRIISSPIIDSRGEIKAAIEMVEDMTDQLKFQEQLRKAQRLESIGNLAGGIAHDFNNILFPIIGMSEILLEDLPQGSSERENVEEILRAGKRGSDLVKQILAFSRQSEHKVMPIRIQTILKEVIKLYRASIPTYIEIHQEIQHDCGKVMADSTQIHQVAMNILTNAFHAVEAEGGSVTIQLKEISMPQEVQYNKPLSADKYALLSITDTGHGMSVDIMDKIFEPYFTTKEKGKGTGLGLATVYGIIKEHRGEIKVKSEVGYGTTFDVYLPLIDEPVEAEVIDNIEASPTGTERILLVDDEEPIARLEKQMLQRLGYSVTSRLNSIDALEAFRSNPQSFDLVISDMSMPNMTGDQLARELFSIRQNIPVVICTGFSERINKEKAESYGIKGFLMKPIIRSELAQMVRKVLDDAKGNSYT